MDTLKGKEQLVQTDVTTTCFQESSVKDGKESQDGDIINEKTMHTGKGLCSIALDGSSPNPNASNGDGGQMTATKCPLPSNSFLSWSWKKI